MKESEPVDRKAGGRLGAATLLDGIGVAVKEALNEYRCQHTGIDGEDEGMPLVDMLTPPFPRRNDIGLGQAEMLLLEDAIMGKIYDLLMPPNIYVSLKNDALLGVMLRT
jgi:hypothetical protein